MRAFIFILTILTIPVMAQDGSFLSDFLLEDELKQGDSFEDYEDTDFSNLWTHTPNFCVLGMIGNNHQRLRMVFTSITQSHENAREYHVMGKSKVKSNICDFNGVIHIDSIVEVQEMHHGLDMMYVDSLLINQGVIFASYKFDESKSQSHTGIFEGKLLTKYYVNARNEIEYDDIQSIADGYSKNAFIGTWKQYGSLRAKICNWADYRIPNSAQDFDIGAGEFSPSEKYYDYGWKEYQRAWLYSDESMLLEEKSEWWK